MGWQGIRAIIGGAVMLAGMGVVTEARAAVSGNVTLTTDYVWRGSSQTGGDAAVQGGLRVGAVNGLYAGMWGSNVAFEPDLGARSEFDAVLGWSGDLSPDWALDANATRYLYPSSAGVLDWTEFSATATFQQRAWVQLAHADDALAGGHPGTYLQTGVRLAVSADTRLEATYGRYWLDSRQGRDYQHVQVSMVHGFAPRWELRVSGHATDEAARQLFPGNAGARLELAVQATF